MIRRFTATLLVAVVTLWGAQTLAAPSASSAIQNFYDTLLSVMKDAEKLGYQGRYQRLEPVVKATFNLPLMTRLAIGPSWATLSKEQQDKLVASFGRYTVANYAANFDGWSGEKFVVEKETTAGNNSGILVETKLIKSNGEPIALNYLMRPDETGQPRIIDVLLNGSVSQLAVYRAEFAALMRDKGPNAVTERLETKVREFEQQK